MTGWPGTARPQPTGWHPRTSMQSGTVSFLVGYRLGALCLRPHSLGTQMSALRQPSLPPQGQGLSSPASFPAPSSPHHLSATSHMTPHLHPKYYLPLRPPSQNYFPPSTSHLPIRWCPTLDIHPPWDIQSLQYYAHPLSLRPNKSGLCYTCSGSL